MPTPTAQAPVSSGCEDLWKGALLNSFWVDSHVPGGNRHKHLEGHKSMKETYKDVDGKELVHMVHRCQLHFPF